MQKTIIEFPEKTELLNHLKKQKQPPTTVDRLWGEAKAWAKARGYEMGGAYASPGTSITVRLLLPNKKHIRFELELSEI